MKQPNNPLPKDPQQTTVPAYSEEPLDTEVASCPACSMLSMHIADSLQEQQVYDATALLRTLYFPPIF